MALEGGVAAKAAAGLCLVGGGGVGAYYGYSYLKGSGTGQEAGGASTEQKATTIDKTKYDQALIDFLSKEGQDIIFEVKKGNGFSDDLGEADPTTLESAVKVRAKVSVTANITSPNTTFKFTNPTGGTSPIDAIKKLNNKKAWTWSCDFEFKKAGGATKSTIEANTRDRIIKAGNKGLFGILKKDVNGYTEETGATTKWKKADLKAVKTKFIQECAKARTNNEEIEAKAELDSSGVTVKIPAIEFKDQGQGENLVANDDAAFKKWFGENYGTKDYKTGG